MLGPVSELVGRREQLGQVAEQALTEPQEPGALLVLPVPPVRNGQLASALQLCGALALAAAVLGGGACRS